MISGAQLQRLSERLALGGGLIILAVAGLISASVVGRWLFDFPIPGDFDLAQIGTAVAVFAFLPLCQLRGGNIIVDFFTASAPLKWRIGLDVASRVLYLGIVILLVVQMARGMIETASVKTSSMVLGVPLAWGMGVAVLAVFWLGVVIVYMLSAAGRKVS
jgi:TRAP-type C4-dicarboxylate transport system permease small subunit